jgi:hypothetical protein
LGHHHFQGIRRTPVQPHTGVPAAHSGVGKRWSKLEKKTALKEQKFFRSTATCRESRHATKEHFFYPAKKLRPSPRQRAIDGCSRLMAAQQVPA